MTTRVISPLAYVYDGLGCGVPRWKRNVVQRGDALELLRSLPDACAALAFFDPQFREVLDKLDYGNEGARQKDRAALPAMTADYIDACLRQIARVLRPSAYCLKWVDTFGLCEAHHKRIEDYLKCAGLLAWDSERLGMGYRGRHAAGRIGDRPCGRKLRRAVRRASPRARIHRL